MYFTLEAGIYTNTHYIICSVYIQCFSERKCCHYVLTQLISPRAEREFNCKRRFNSRYLYIQIYTYTLLAFLYIHDANEITPHVIVVCVLYIVITHIVSLTFSHRYTRFLAHASILAFSITSIRRTIYLVADLKSPVEA